MSMNTLTLASGLSDHDLLARIGVLAGREREATVELVAHLAALDTRPALYAAQGFGSLFSYVLLERVEKTKLGAAAKPRPRPIRPETDREIRTSILPSRDVPR